MTTTGMGTTMKQGRDMGTTTARTRKKVARMRDDDDKIRMD
jgi:hypothetical protein